MTLMQRVRPLMVLLLALMGLGATGARAHGVTLLVHYPFPEASPFHTQFLLPWTQQLEEHSAGLLRFRLVPASDPAKLADEVTQRLCDIAFVPSKAAPERFPAMRALEHVPIKHGAVGASRAAWEYFRLNDLAEKDFDALRLLAVSLVPGADQDVQVGMLIMNGRSHKALVDALKKVMEEHSGADTSARLANALAGGAAGASRDSLDRWVDHASQNGVNAKALAQSARELLAEYDVPSK